MGIQEIQRVVKLSSPSVAEYHIKKLVRAGLVQEGGEWLFCRQGRLRERDQDKEVGNPVSGHTTYFAFFLSTLIILVMFTAYETFKTWTATSEIGTKT